MLNSNKYIDYLYQRLKYKVLGGVLKPKVVILMFHRIVDEYSEERLPLRNNEVSIEFLEKLILLLKTNNCEFITMDELHDLILSKRIKATINKKVIISLDDGYSDLLTKALPIFARHQVPFISYIPNSFINLNGIVWWEDLQRHFFRENSKNIKGLKKEFYRTSKNILKSGARVENTLNAITGLEYSNSNYTKDFLRWHELLKISKNDLSDIGFHTYNHLSLRYISRNLIISDLEKSKNEFNSKKINYSLHFAYPYGTVYSVGMREKAIIKEFGFKTAVTTNSGFIYKIGNNLHSLPRISVTENEKFMEIINKFIK